MKTILTALITLAVWPSLADTIILKDKQPIEGAVLGYENSQFLVRVDGEIRRIAADKVARVQVSTEWPTRKALLKAMRHTREDIRIYDSQSHILVRWDDKSLASWDALDRVFDEVFPRWENARNTIVFLHRRLLELGDGFKLHYNDTVVYVGHHEDRRIDTWPEMKDAMNTLMFENMRPTVIPH
jgi:hypothetical protein